MWPLECGDGHELPLPADGAGPAGRERGFQLAPRTPLTVSTVRRSRWKISKPSTWFCSHAVRVTISRSIHRVVCAPLARGPAFVLIHLGRNASDSESASPGTREHSTKNRQHNNASACAYLVATDTLAESIALGETRRAEMVLDLGRIPKSQGEVGK